MVLNTFRGLSCHSQLDELKYVSVMAGHHKWAWRISISPRLLFFCLIPKQNCLHFWQGYKNIKKDNNMSWVNLMITHNICFYGELTKIIVELSSNSLWASSWDYGTYHIGDQQRLRRACACAQSCQSIHSSHTWNKRRVRPKIRNLAP